MMKFALCAVALSAVAGAANAQVAMNEISRINIAQVRFQEWNGAVNPSYIGFRPSAIAFDNGRLFVAGFSNSAAQPLGIVEVTNVGNTGAFNGAFSNTFGIRSTGSNQGYSGLYLRGNTLAYAYDQNSSLASSNSVGVYNVSNVGVSTAAVTWQQTQRGGSGVAINSAGNVVHSVVASNFVRQWNGSTGVGIWTGQTNGPTITTNTSGVTFGNNFYRDIDVDPATGRVFQRYSSGIAAWDLNTVNNAATPTNAAFAIPNGVVNNIGQNLAVAGNAPITGSFVIYNNRSNAGAGQAFGSNFQVITTSGASMTLTLNLLSSITLTNDGYFDFSYDYSTQRLAVLDSSNGFIHIFQVPTPAAGAMFGMAGLFAARRRR